MQDLSFSDGRKLALLRLAGVRVVNSDDPAARRAAGLRPLGPAMENRFLYALEGSSSARLFFEVIRVPDARQALRYTLARGLPTDSVALVEGIEGFRRKAPVVSVGETVWEKASAFRIAVKTPTPALLALAITFDPDWRVWVDGQRQATIPVDSVFLGTLVTPGTHLIRGEFRDPSFPIGWAIGLATLFGLFFWTRPRPLQVDSGR